MGILLYWKKREPVQTIDAGGFASIYAQFGYNEASERDPYSLSYTYDLSPSMRLLMLDTCQYEPKNLVEGRIKQRPWCGWMSS